MDTHHGLEAHAGKREGGGGGQARGREHGEQEDDGRELQLNVTTGQEGRSWSQARVMRRGGWRPRLSSPWSPSRALFHHDEADRHKHARSTVTKAIPSFPESSRRWSVEHRKRGGSGSIHPPIAFLENMRLEKFEYDGRIVAWSRRGRPDSSCTAEDHGNRHEP